MFCISLFVSREGKEITNQSSNVRLKYGFVDFEM